MYIYIQGVPRVQRTSAVRGFVSCIVTTILHERNETCDRCVRVRVWTRDPFPEKTWYSIVYRTLNIHVYTACMHLCTRKKCSYNRYYIPTNGHTRCAEVVEMQRGSDMAPSDCDNNRRCRPDRFALLPYPMVLMNNYYNEYDEILETFFTNTRARVSVEKRIPAVP